MTATPFGGRSRRPGPRQTSRPRSTAAGSHASPPCSIADATPSNACSAGSRTSAASRPATTAGDQLPRRRLPRRNRQLLVMSPEGRTSNARSLSGTRCSRPPSSVPLALSRVGSPHRSHPIARPEPHRSRRRQNQELEGKSADLARAGQRPQPCHEGWHLRIG